VINRNF